MLLSEFIKELEAIKAEHGDIEVSTPDLEDDEYLFAEPFCSLLTDADTGKVCTLVIDDGSWQEDEQDE